MNRRRPFVFLLSALPSVAVIPESPTNFSRLHLIIPQRFFPSALPIFSCPFFSVSGLSPRRSRFQKLLVFYFQGYLSSIQDLILQSAFQILDRSNVNVNLYYLYYLH